MRLIELAERLNVADALIDSGAPNPRGDQPVERGNRRSPGANRGLMAA